MNNEFKSLRELYDRIKPALRCKCNEFKKMGYKNIKESDIWNYITDKKWKESIGLSISEMVNDIFDVKYEDVTNHMISKIETELREPYFDE